MGILNVTPDSFSDAGRFQDASAAVERAHAMWEEGAVIIDVGGESTRPAGVTYGHGAEAVPAEEELRRVLPIVERIATGLPEAVISIDTYKSDVAAACLDAGAHLINDVTGLRLNPELAEEVGRRDAGLIVMHSRGRPGALTHEQEAQGDVVADVRAALSESIERAVSAGVQSIAIDPGFGFGKSPRDNLRLIAGTERLLELSRPVLVAVSRKSTIGLAMNRGDEPPPPEQRAAGSLGAAALAVCLGASIVRTHDVRETVEMVRVLTAVMEAGEDLLPFGWARREVAAA